MSYRYSRELIASEEEDLERTRRSIAEYRSDGRDRHITLPELFDLERRQEEYLNTIDPKGRSKRNRYPQTYNTGTCSTSAASKASLAETLTDRVIRDLTESIAKNQGRISNGAYGQGCTLEDLEELLELQQRELAERTGQSTTSTKQKQPESSKAQQPKSSKTQAPKPSKAEQSSSSKAPSKPSGSGHGKKKRPATRSSSGHSTERDEEERTIYKCASVLTDRIITLSLHWKYGPPVLLRDLDHLELANTNLYNLNDLMFEPYEKHSEAVSCIEEYLRGLDKEVERNRDSAATVAYGVGMTRTFADLARSFRGESQSLENYMQLLDLGFGIGPWSVEREYRRSQAELRAKNAMDNDNYPREVRRRAKSDFRELRSLAPRAPESPEYSDAGHYSQSDPQHSAPASVADDTDYPAPPALLKWHGQEVDFDKLVHSSSGSESD